MAINTFSPNTKIRSADINANFQGIVNGSELRSLTNSLKFSSTGVGVNGVDTVGTELNMWNWNGSNRLEGGSNTRGMNILASGINLTNQYRCQLINSGAQSITTNVETVLSWDSENFDVGALHSTTSNTSRITIPTSADGVYLLNTYINWSLNNSDWRWIGIKLNGTNIAMDRRSPVNEAGATCSVISNAVAGDIFTVAVYQNSGSTLTVAATSTFSAVKVA